MAHILIVDDSVSIRKSVRFVLEESSHTVREAQDGVEGLAALKEERFNLIITDINMPVMGGIEFTGHIRALPDYRFTPVLVLTTESQGSVMEEGKKAGATGWIVKPFTNDKLLDTVAKVLG